MAITIEDKVRQIDENLVKVAEVVHLACHRVAELEAEKEELKVRVKALEGRVQHLAFQA